MRGGERLGGGGGKEAKGAAKIGFRKNYVRERQRERERCSIPNGTLFPFSVLLLNRSITVVHYIGNRVLCGTQPESGRKIQIGEKGWGGLLRVVGALRGRWFGHGELLGLWS